MTVATILVFEDDEASRMLVTYLLESAGYLVHAAENGAVGLELALSRPHDLIVCDLQMPILNGYQVAQTLRSHPIGVQCPWWRSPRFRCQATAKRRWRWVLMTTSPSPSRPRPLSNKLRRSCVICPLVHRVSADASRQPEP